MEEMRWLVVLVLGVGCGPRVVRVKAADGSHVTAKRAAGRTIRRVAAGARLEHVQRESGMHEEEVWLATWTARDGRVHRMRVLAGSGRVLDHDVELAAAEVPAAVRQRAEEEQGLAERAGPIRYVRHANGTYVAFGIAGRREWRIAMTARGSETIEPEEEPERECDTGWDEEDDSYESGSGSGSSANGVDTPGVSP